MQDALPVELAMRSKLAKAWKRLPKTVRRMIVLVIGSTLIVTGLLLIILPGPFTMPFLILGLIILAAEFAWAESLLVRVREQGSKLNPKKLFKKQK
jgi:hypothetical protein